MKMLHRKEGKNMEGNWRGGGLGRQRREAWFLEDPNRSVNIEGSERKYKKQNVKILYRCIRLIFVSENNILITRNVFLKTLTWNNFYIQLSFLRDLS
jgi:hypothetical protein